MYTNCTSLTRQERIAAQRINRCHILDHHTITNIDIINDFVVTIEIQDAIIVRAGRF